MNIFVNDLDPKKAAQQQCDKHVVKMIIEYAQMLSTAHRMLDGKLVMKPSKSGKRMVKYYDLYEGADDLEAELIYYKAVHHNHPCTVWTRETSENYRWLWESARALSDEYTYRYGKVHKTDSVIWALRSTPRNIKQGGITPFAQAMPDEYKSIDPVKAYRDYYISKQHNFKMVWTKREVPGWFKYANV